MRQGPALDFRQCQSLIAPVLKEEIDKALWSIHVDKEPGMDGLNSYVYIKAWPVIKHDINSVCLQFFTSCSLEKINYTVVTLIPMVLNASYVKQFMPILCCNVIYKIITKVLGLRMQRVIQAQSGFNPGRQIIDNVLITLELIKGYGSRSLSPRCMIKYDLRKAYDSLEWPILRHVLVAMVFPSLYVEWLMECITSVSYSILVNGVPSPPFQARKSLKQGDPL